MDQNKTLTIRQPERYAGCDLKKLVKAVESNTFESYIGGKEVGHLFKTIFP
jgi:hypothetical protein